MLSGLPACWRRSSREHTWLPVDLRAGPRPSEVLTPSPVLGMYTAHCSHNGSCSKGTQLGKVGCCWDHLEGIPDGPAKASVHRVWRLLQVGEEIYSSWLPKISLLWTFPCLLHLPSTTRFSLVTQTVKDLPAMREIWVRSLSHKEPLEK